MERNCFWRFLRAFSPRGRPTTVLSGGELHILYTCTPIVHAAYSRLYWAIYRIGVVNSHSIYVLVFRRLITIVGSRIMTGARAPLNKTPLQMSLDFTPGSAPDRVRSQGRWNFFGKFSTTIQDLDHHATQHSKPIVILHNLIMNWCVWQISKIVLFYTGTIINIFDYFNALYNNNNNLRYVILRIEFTPIH